MRIEQRFFSYITLLLLFTGIGYTFWPEFFVKKNYNTYIVKPVSKLFSSKKEKSSKECDCRPSSTSDWFQKIKSFSLMNEVKNLKNQTKTNLNSRFSKTQAKFKKLEKLMKIKN
ncbi:MAG: hypothetical protein OEZ13_12100 [Spirochaetia bacterium]|nr:hypothetical protein [Spirochaetia bacterium]